jgi:hypothetical protein
MIFLQALPDFLRFEPSEHGSMGLKYVQDNILLERRMLFARYFGAAD